MMCVQNKYAEYVLDVGCWNKPQRFSIRTMTGGVFMENPHMFFQTTSSMWMLMNVGVVSRGSGNRITAATSVSWNCDIWKNTLHSKGYNRLGQCVEFQSRPQNTWWGLEHGMQRWFLYSILHELLIVHPLEKWPAWKNVYFGCSNNVCFGVFSFCVQGSIDATIVLCEMLKTKEKAMYFFSMDISNQTDSHLHPMVDSESDLFKTTLATIC